MADLSSESVEDYGSEWVIDPMAMAGWLVLGIMAILVILAILATIQERRKGGSLDPLPAPVIKKAVEDATQNGS